MATLRALSRARFRVYTLLPVVAFAALGNMGCAEQSIAAKYPHLDRRSVCLVVPGMEPDTTEYIFTENNVAISNFHPEVVDRVAPTARTVFEYDPNADTRSPRFLPAPYDQLQCPERFSPLPSRDAETPPLPEASLELIVHEPRPEIVPRAVAEELAKCSNQISSQVNSIQHTMRLNVYVTNAGRTVFAYVAESTLGDRQLNACVTKVLRATQWSAVAASAPNVAAAPAALKGLIAQAEPAQPLPDPGEQSGIRRILPQPSTPPANAPTGVRIPRIFVIPLGPIAAAAAVFGIIYFWSDNDVPAWSDDLNPITRLPYTSPQEYEEVRRLSPDEIKQRQVQEAIKNSKPVAPPTSTPSPQPQPEPEKQPDEKCDKFAAKIKEIIEAERKETPKGGFPQGRKGIKWRWIEIAANEGEWGYKPDGSLGDKLKGHMKQYTDGQGELISELEKWYKRECHQMGHTLPHNALQYAAQKPEIGPGKPLEPAPTPIWTPQPVTPAVIAPQPKKLSK